MTEDHQGRKPRNNDAKRRLARDRRPGIGFFSSLLERGARQEMTGKRVTALGITLGAVACVTAIGDDTDVMPKATSLAQWLYDFRFHVDKTQGDFGVLIGVSQSTVQQWEAGRRAPRAPTMLLLTRMAAETGFEPPPEREIIRKPRRTN